jgi:hypothetical protein
VKAKCTKPLLFAKYMVLSTLLTNQSVRNTISSWSELFYKENNEINLFLIFSILYFWLFHNFTSVILEKKQKCVPRSSSFLLSTGIFVEWKKYNFLLSLFSIFLEKASLLYTFIQAVYQKKMCTHIFFVEIVY